MPPSKISPSINPTQNPSPNHWGGSNFLRGQLSRYHQKVSLNFIFHLCVKLFSRNCIVLLLSWELLFQLAINFVSRNWIKLILRISYCCYWEPFLLFSKNYSLILPWLVQRLLYLGQKKLSCFYKLTRWNFFYDSPVRIVEYISEYIFLISKKKTKAKKSKNTKKAKETREEKRISRENWLKK